MIRDSSASLLPKRVRLTSVSSDKSKYFLSFVNFAKFFASFVFVFCSCYYIDKIKDKKVRSWKNIFCFFY